MKNQNVQLIGTPCGQHGPYTFYKAFKYTKNGNKQLVTLSDFFFVKMWRDSDLLCIGELQLLWMDKNVDQVLTSLRLYFLPENTPDGRMDHGEDEVLAISEKVVIRLEDLISLIMVEAEWTWGRLAKCETELKNVRLEFAKLVDAKNSNEISGYSSCFSVDFSDIEKEINQIKNLMSCNRPHVIILSYPKYCRYRAMMKRLEGIEDMFLKYKIVNALGGFYVKHPNTRVLYCKDTFDYPELEGHELLCNHLAPKLKGRPRGKRKKRSVSPVSEVNDSECSHNDQDYSREKNKNGLRLNTHITLRRSTRYQESSEKKDFFRKLTAFMNSNNTPIGRIPSLGFKELNLHEFFTRVKKLGGYDCVTSNRLWKSLLDDMSENYNNTSTATVIRRHYERFLLPYERHINGGQKPLSLSEKRRLQNKRGCNTVNNIGKHSSCSSQIFTTQKTSRPDIKETNPSEGKPSALRSVRVKPDRRNYKRNTEDNSIIVSNALPSEHQLQNSDNKTVSERCIQTTTNTMGISRVGFGNEVIELEEKAISKEEEIDSIFDQKDSEENKTKKLKTDPSQMDDIAKSNNGLEKTLGVGSLSTSIQLDPVDTGKENIIAIKIENISAEVKSEVPEKTKKSKIPNDLISDSSGEEFIHDIRKRKLDILKEGGLEVTPICPVLLTTPLKNNKQSVLHKSRSTFQTYTEDVKIKDRLLHSTSSSIISSKHSSQVEISLQTVDKCEPITSPIKFENNSTPPKVLQSRSIYTYSEKIVYGNPKELCNSPIKPHYENVVINSPKISGDPVDLSVNSPFVPQVEVVRIPQVSINSSRDNVKKKLAESKNSSIMICRKLSPSLEITLVERDKKASPFLHKSQNPAQVPSKITNSQSSIEERLLNQYFIPNTIQKCVDNNINKTSNSNVEKLSTDSKIVYKNVPLNGNVGRVSTQVNQPLMQTLIDIKNLHNSNTPNFSQYGPNTFDSIKQISPYFSVLDPSIYYSVALQNLYAPGTLPSPLRQLPTFEELNCYAELIAHGRMNFPFPLGKDEHLGRNCDKK